jgi:hypothetical protein
MVGWRIPFLSRSGRLLLIKHVLSFIPIYAMAYFDVP